MPRNEDAKLAGIEVKSQPAEERAIIDVALKDFGAAKETKKRLVLPEDLVQRIKYKHHLYD